MNRSASSRNWSILVPVVILCQVFLPGALPQGSARAQVAPGSTPGAGVSRAGITAWQEGRLEDAARLLQEAVRVEAGEASAQAELQYTLARVYAALRNEPDATRAINRAIELQPENLLYREWQHRIGSRAFRLIQKARERDMLRDMLRIDPDNAYANTSVAEERVLVFQHHHNRIRIPELTPFESPLPTNREIRRTMDERDRDIPEPPEPPMNQNPFNIEEMRQRGYNVLDLGVRADSAFEEGMTRLTGVLERDPAYFEAYLPLMKLLTGAGDHNSQFYWASQMRYQFPDSAAAWLYLGYAAHRLGRSEVANEAFAGALDLLPLPDRQVFEDVHRVMNSAGEARVADDALFDAARFWAARDPRYLTEENEREAEHYSRLVYADLHFSEPLIDLRGWDADRGEIYVRFGQPRTMYFMSNVVESCGGRLTAGNMNSIGNFHIFEYPDFRFVFGNAGNFAEGSQVLIPPLNEYTLYTPCSEAFLSDRSTAADFDYVIKANNTIYDTPEVFDFTPPGRQVDFPYLATAFKRPDGGADLYVAYGIPIAMGPGQQALRPALEVGAFVVPPDGPPLTSRRRQLAAQAGVPLNLFGSQALWVGTLALDAPAGDHTLAVEFDVPSQRTGGADRSEVSIPDFSAGTFQMSDLQLAYLVEASDDQPADSLSMYQRHGYQISPAPWGVFGVEQPLYLYFELYNLALSAQSRTRYRVEAILVGASDEGRLAQLFRRAFRRGGASDAVAVQFEGAGSSAEEGQYFILDAGAQPPGEYVLAVRVEDLERGQTVERRRRITLE